ncbi:PDGLE domain-containing protein [Methanocella conradii]|uniref:PDGLE domain-containing protein n=1 Tax=Methanocella conradii TaxID=1175444 RepID=UPI0024B3471E|nr:PDGLE domain-containing protein [Methanocella conradii]MDI6895722.1 PDGLE domain-containing protein [Methanocella conradii]
MDKNLKTILIALAILVVLTPLGLLATGETFGEWGNEELKEKLGYVPPGIESLSSLWSAPMPDYTVPGLENSFAESAVGYIITAIIGGGLSLGALYLIGKLMASDKTE